MQIDIASHQRWLRDVASVQDDVAAEALTNLAIGVKSDQERKIVSDLDRPNPFTRNSMVSYRATPRRLESGVFVKNKQAEYLHRLVTRSPITRRPVGRAIFIPVSSQRTDAFGNMPRSKRRTALRGSTYTRRNARGNAAVYQRVGNRSERLGTYVSATQYRRQHWGFYDHSIEYAGRNFGRIWGAAWDRRVPRLAIR